MISGKDFAEKYFSQSKESEKLFSTGDSELDAILTEVYYSGIEDGYDYAQKEFAEKKKGDDKSTAAGVTIAGASGGALLGNKVANKRILKKADKQIVEVEKKTKEAIVEIEKKHFRPGRLRNSGIDKEGQEMIKGIEAGAKESINKIKKAAEETITKGNKKTRLIAGAGLATAGIVTAGGVIKRKRDEKRA